tara:strand:- start:89 stop:283 length:195 start_codon:yes stop_codon:yes gene_type:complete
MNDINVTDIGANYGLYIYPLTITVSANYGPIYNLNIEFESDIQPFVNMSNLGSFNTFYLKIVEA